MKKTIVVSIRLEDSHVRKWSSDERDAMTIGYTIASAILASEVSTHLVLARLIEAVLEQSDCPDHLNACFDEIYRLAASVDEIEKAYIDRIKNRNP